MKIVMFTDQEIIWLNQLLDVALKAVGRQAVPSFVAIVNKLATAQEAETEKVAE